MAAVQPQEAYDSAEEQDLDENIYDEVEEAADAARQELWGTEERQTVMLDNIANLVYKISEDTKSRERIQQDDKLRVLINKKIGLLNMLKAKVSHYPLPPTRLLVLGASGRGKSSLIVDRLINRVWRGLIDKIYLISSTANYDKAYTRIVGNVTKLTSYHPKLIPQIMRREREKYGNKRRVMLYFDDVAGQGIDITLKPNDPFAKLTTTSRHIGTEITPDLGWIVVFAAQCMSLVPTVYRKNCDKVAMFLEENPEERRWIYKSYSFCKEHHFDAFMADNLTKKHDFLYLSKDQGFGTWWLNLTQPLESQVERIKEHERMSRKRRLDREVGHKTTHELPGTDPSDNKLSLHPKRAKIHM